MAVLRTAIKWVNPDGTTFVLDDYESINIRRSTDLEQNSCEITLKNEAEVQPYVEGSQTVFSPDQSVDVFAVIDDDGGGLDTSDTSSDRIFNGRVSEVGHKEDDKSSKLTLDCADSSFVVLNKTWVGEESDTPPNLIKSIIGHVNNSVSTTWDKVSATLSSNGGGIQDTDSAGNAFTSTKFSKVFKPAVECIQELSQPDYTGDTVPYRFHVDSDNVFHWFHPDDSAAHVIHANQTSPQTVTYTHPVTGEDDIEVADSNTHHVLNYSLKESVYDVVNYIIFKAGEDMDGVQVANYAYNDGTGAPIVKDSVRNWEDIARDMKEEDRRAGNITKTYGDEYAYPTSYPMTPEWSYTNTSVANDSEYNTEFEKEAIRRARGRADLEFKFNGSPKLKGTIELRGKSVYEPNDAVWFRAPRTGISGAFLRTTDVQHNLSKNGWFTTLTVEEEIPQVT